MLSLSTVDRVRGFRLETTAKLIVEQNLRKRSRISTGQGSEALLKDEQEFVQVSRSTALIQMKVMIEPPVGSKWLGTQGNIFCRPTPLCKSHDRFQPGPAVVADTS